jgi:hypothetical protein
MKSDHHHHHHHHHLLLLLLLLLDEGSIIFEMILLLNLDQHLHEQMLLMLDEVEQQNVWRFMNQYVE